MYISYNKLWKRLIDENWTKQKLREEAGISAASVSKMKAGKNINTDILLKICKCLKCDLGDIAEVINKDREEDTIKNN